MAAAQKAFFTNSFESWEDVSQENPFGQLQKTVTSPRRICLPISSLDAEYAPSRCAVSFSRWTRYNPNSMSAPAGQLKASVLWRATGTSPTYNPPVSELAPLEVFEAASMGVKPEAREKWCDWRNRRCPRSSPPSSVRLVTDSGLDFGRQPIPRMSTDSSLTRALQKASGGDGGGGGLAATKQYGLHGLTSEDLPSAFELDSDEED
ncbi:hypothetical protein ACEQ8H_003441 [Pleosporales sp. CAS-2024a]